MSWWTSSRLEDMFLAAVDTRFILTFYELNYIKEECRCRRASILARLHRARPVGALGC